MKKIYALIVFLFCCSAAFASAPAIELHVDVTTPYPQKFDFSVRAGNTPVITVACLSNDVAYTGFEAGWTAEFNYFLDDKASAGVTIPGALSISTGVITFTALTNSFPAAGKYFAEIYLHKGISPKLTIAQGQLTVSRSPSSGSFANLNLSNRLNWDIVQNIGEVPWAAGAEPVFHASVAYQITSVMTDQWTTAYGYSTRIAALETGRVTYVAYNAFTNAQTATNASLQSQINNISNIVPTGAVGYVEYDAHVSAQAATNAAFSALFVAQGNTNAAFSGLFTAQAISNALFNTRITSNETFRAAQVNTNAGFQALFDAQSNTNVGFDARIASNELSIAEQGDTNTAFQALFDVQVNTNIALQGQITTNLANQITTNSGFELRISSNEYFVAYTQPTINTNLQGQITTNLTEQGNTNVIFEARITSNETFNTAQVNTNAGFQSFIDDQGGTNTAFETRIASNETFRTVIQPLTNTALQTQITDNRATQTNVNAGYNVRITSNEVFSTITQPATNAALQSQITANLTNQAATNVLFDARIFSLEVGSTLANRFDEMIVANVGLVDTNISGLTDGVYTGSLTEVSYTGTTEVVKGRVYVWGFTKSSAFGTGTMTLAGATLNVTAAGLTSNHFVALTGDTEHVLTLTGTGDAKADAADVFVREVTNGVLSVASLVHSPLGSFEQMHVAPGGTIGEVWTLTNDVTGAGEWATAGAGDMLKPVYDTNDDGKVNAADDSDALGGVAAAGYATTGALAEVQGEVLTLSNQVAGLTAVQRYQACATAGKEVNVIATKAGVTASWTGTVLTIDNTVDAVITFIEIRWPAASGDSFDVVLVKNGLTHDAATSRFTMNYRIWNESSGAPITGANARPDPANYDRIKVMALSGATTFIVVLN